MSKFDSYGSAVDSVETVRGKCTTVFGVDVAKSQDTTFFGVGTTGEDCSVIELEAATEFEKLSPSCAGCAMGDPPRAQVPVSQTQRAQEPVSDTQRAQVPLSLTQRAQQPMQPQAPVAASCVLLPYSLLHEVRVPEKAFVAMISHSGE